MPPPPALATFTFQTPTCQLRITGQPSALGQVADHPILSQLRFQLQFQGTVPLILRGTDTELIALTAAIDTYLQQRSHPTAAIEPIGLTGCRLHLSSLSLTTKDLTRLDLSALELADLVDVLGQQSAALRIYPALPQASVQRWPRLIWTVGPVAAGVVMAVWGVARFSAPVPVVTSLPAPTPELPAELPPLANADAERGTPQAAGSTVESPATDNAESVPVPTPAAESGPNSPSPSHPLPSDSLSSAPPSGDTSPTAPSADSGPVPSPEDLEREPSTPLPAARTSDLTIASTPAQADTEPAETAPVAVAETSPAAAAVDLPAPLPWVSELEQSFLAAVPTPHLGLLAYEGTLGEGGILTQLTPLTAAAMQQTDLDLPALGTVITPSLGQFPQRFRVWLRSDGTVTVEPLTTDN